MNRVQTAARDHDAAAGRREKFLRDVLRGLGGNQKSIPSKYFYDDEGSKLFDRICGLAEYYLTSIEFSIMKNNIRSIVSEIGSNIVLVEFGSGSSEKTRILLDTIRDVRTYVPVDISDEYLTAACRSLSFRYPSLPIHPLCTDYAEPVVLPTIPDPETRVVSFFSGSTIGNFDPEDAAGFLRNTGRLIGEKGCLLVGVDLKKDPAVLHAAYNDSEGVTEAFNKNILVRINRELCANFRPDLFRHYAFYDPFQGRIEMHLTSVQAQTVLVGDTEIMFEREESIHTENSYKYSLQEFGDLAARGGMRTVSIWTDPQEYFGILLLIPASRPD